MTPSKVAAMDAMASTERGISYRDAMETLRHDRDMKRALVGVPLPLTFFCIFVAMLSRHIPTSALYEQGYSVSSVLDSSGTDAITTETTMKFQNIGAISDVFEWLTNTFIPSVFVTEDYNGVQLTKDKWGRIANFNKVLGAVTFENTRAAIHPCQAAKFLVGLYPNCYDPNNVDTTTHLISFDTNATEATDLINQLKTQGNWLDFSTQQLLITVVAYNGEVQGYTVTKLQLDFHQGGYVETSSTTTPTISDPYKSKDAMALDILVGICLVLSLLPYLVGFVRILRSPQQWRALYDTCEVGPIIVNLATSAFTIAFYAIWFTMVQLMYAQSFRDNLARLVVSGKQFDANSNERQGLIAVTRSLEDVAYLTTALRLVATGAVFALGTDILMQCRFHPRLNIFTRTVANALHQFAGFFVVFVVIFVTFTVSGTILFGDRVESFSNLWYTMESCVNMLFGNFDYDTIKDIDAPVGMLYYWAYMIVVFLVLLNMMLAIVLDSYEELSQEAAKSKYNVSLLRTIGNMLYDREMRAMQYQRTQTARLVHHIGKTVDASRLDVVFRGRVIPDVLERALLESGFGDMTDPGKDQEEMVVTETMVVQLFPAAKITSQEARATIDFLLEGCQSDSNSTTTPTTGDASPRPPSPLAKAFSTILHATEQVEQVWHEATDPGPTETQLMLVRLDAVERKLDRLLARETS